MWPPPKPPMWPPPPPCPPPPPPRAWASVARRLPASTALAKTIITRPLMTFSFWDGRDLPPQDFVGGECQRQTSASRWSGDGDDCLPALLNSGSILGLPLLGFFASRKPVTTSCAGPLGRPPLNGTKPTL